MILGSKHGDFRNSKSCTPMNVSIIIKCYPVLILICFAMVVRTEFKTLGRFQNMVPQVQNMANWFSACFELSVKIINMISVTLDFLLLTLRAA